MVPRLQSLILLLLFAGMLAAQQASDSADRKEEPPAQSLAERIKVDPSALSFKHIRDNTRLPWVKYTGPRELGEKDDRYWEEMAYEQLLLQAAQFSQQDLESHARKDVFFGDINSVNSAPNYRLELLTFEGTLSRLVTQDQTLANVKKEGINAVYEAWVFPKGETTPICLFFTELPPGLAPMKDVAKDTMNRPVRVTGYFFKLSVYEQKALDSNDPDRHKLWRAPVLIGKSITVLDDNALADPNPGWHSTFLPVVIGGILATGFILVYLGWCYRRGDRAILSKALEKRNQNPFEND